MYKVVRFYERKAARPVIKTGLTLEEAKRHCSDPETSSETAGGARERRRTKTEGPWFDGYTQE